MKDTTNAKNEVMGGDAHPLVKEAFLHAFVATEKCDELFDTMTEDNFLVMYGHVLRSITALKSAVSILNKSPQSDTINEEEFYAVHDILLVPLGIIAKLKNVPSVADVKRLGFWPTDLM